MTSQCPQCKASVDHEDYLFEVQCTSCKMRFNPYFDGVDTEAVAEKALDGGNPPLEEAPVPAEGFSESEQMFAEIRDFGEKVGTPEEPSAAPAPTASTSAPPAARSAPRANVPAAVSAEFVLTAGSDIQGSRVQAYLSPVSVWASLPESKDEPPLQKAFEQIMALSMGQGANAALHLRWSLTPDGASAVVTAIPVVVSTGGSSDGSPANQ